MISKNMGLPSTLFLKTLFTKCMNKIFNGVYNIMSKKQQQQQLYDISAL